MSAEHVGVGVDPLLERLSHTELNEGSYSGGYAPDDVISGKYRLVRPIGRGGMGVVWEAYSEVLDIKVAVKLIQQFSASLEMQQRLLLEARAAARLVDPGVIRIFDCGKTSKGDPYIIMELLEGEDLATRLEHRGRLAPIEAVRTLLPIVRALGAAHAANIVHRDVKPENVFFTKSLMAEEQPKLFDFGIAKVDLDWEKRLTQAGSTLGSPSYMSPEQAQGNEIDRRSDLWGISVVLYESITGQLPFDGQSYQAIVHAILCAPAKTFAAQGVDEPELWTIIAKGLEREREQRWQSSNEFAEALGTWLIDRGITHDVTGASLHATRTHNLQERLRTSETAKPPSKSGNQLRAPLLELVSTVQRNSLSGYWVRTSQRSRYFLTMLAVAAFGAVVAFGIKHALHKVPPAPAQARAAQVVPERTELVAKPKPAGAAPSAAIADREPGPSQSDVTLAPIANVASPASRAAHNTANTNKPSKPKAKAARPSDEPFRSPFE